MIDVAALALERIVAASPIWVQVRDTFTGKAPRGPLQVRLERREGQEWVPLEYPHRLSNAGDLSAVNLGRTREPGLVGTFDVRVRVTAPGAIAEPEPLVVQVTAWPPDAPNVPAAPTVCRLFPAPDYPFPPGVPVLTGRVENAAGEPVGRAWVTVDETVRNTLLTEEVRTDEAGWFRLPVRWSSGATTVNAEKARPPQNPLSASIAVNLPADLSSIHLITVV